MHLAFDDQLYARPIATRQFVNYLPFAITAAAVNFYPAQGLPISSSFANYIMLACFRFVLWKVGEVFFSSPSRVRIAVYLAFVALCPPNLF